MGNFTDTYEISRLIEEDKKDSEQLKILMAAKVSESTKVRDIDEAIARKTNDIIERRIRIYELKKGEIKRDRYKVNTRK